MSATEPDPSADRTDLVEVARLLDVSPVAGVLDGSRSGAHVQQVVRRDGTAAVLKLTVATDGHQRDVAEHELTFYQEVATGIPLRTPALLDLHRDRRTVALLLTAHGPPVPAPDWDHERWLTLAADLADLHEVPLPPGERWSRTGGPLAGSDPEFARTHWAGTDVGRTVAPLLADPAPLFGDVARQPRCFGHGDCHTGNLLVDGPALVWADWQQVGGCRPADELAFPSVRATPSGAVLPLAEMIALYAERRRLDPVELRQSVTAAELAIFLFAWPPFAGFLSAARVQRVHRRVVHLVEQWHAGRSGTR